MMKKLIAFLFIVMIISVAGCKPAAKQTKDVAGEAIVNDVGNGIESVNTIEDDLNMDDLESLDSELQDLQDI